MHMRRFKWILGLLVAASLIVTLPASGQLNREDTDWAFHGGDLKNSKYAPLDQIDERNFDDLEIAWRWGSISNRVTENNLAIKVNQFKPTPLVVDGIMYVVTMVGQVVAIDPVTGETLWDFDPESYKAGRPANMGFQHRGVSFYDDGEDGRIIHGAHDRKLWALDAKTGVPEETFADGGPVNLELSLGSDMNMRNVTHSSPVGICNDTIIVGSIVFDMPTLKENPPGHVRGFDARTGALKWIFHTIPQEGEFGVETWENDSWKYSGNTNVWSSFATDEELNYVYLPTSVPTNDLYGGHRLGDNLFSNSIVCLNAETGERVWHFQAIHHGVWDYDFPTASNLVDATINGRKRKLLAQVGKTAFCYVFDRVTGEPIWPIEERPVPQSRVPGERISPTQPFPTKPAAFDRQGLSKEDLIDFTPELRAKALEIVDGYELGPMYTPPNADEKGTLGLPYVTGGTNWRGAAHDPETAILYVPSMTNFGYWHVYAPDPNRSNMKYVSGLFDPGNPSRGRGAIGGLPLIKPPYSRVTAIDLNTGEHLWMTPHGDGPVNHPLLKNLDLPPMGVPGNLSGGPLVTKTLLFVAQPAFSVGSEMDQQHKLTVFDKKTGEILGIVPLPGEPAGNPISYMADGKQFIVIAVGGGPYLAGMMGTASTPAELIALALP